jgi:hypothetical protein
MSASFQAPRTFGVQGDPNRVNVSVHFDFDQRAGYQQYLTFWAAPIAASIAPDMFPR